MRAIETWHLRARTLGAMALLCVAQLTVTLVPFRWWRGTLGQLGAIAGIMPGDGQSGAAQRLAAHVGRGAARLPFATNCLPRAMALCWLLRRAGVAYRFKIAARPAAVRHIDPVAGDADLHAWVEADDTIVIGALPGPWMEVLVLSA